MKTRDLVKIGIPAGPCAEAAKQILNRTHRAKRRMSTVLDDLGRVATSPATFVDDPVYAGLAQRLLDHAAAGQRFTPRESDAPYHIWGDNLEATAVQQLQNACKLPIAVSGALMPDAHVGYGLPIGGVLATINAVIPYAVVWPRH
jgi:tRNA-splicing ligase RtcB